MSEEDLFSHNVYLSLLMCGTYAYEREWAAEACDLIIVICYVTVSSSISEPDWAV